MSQSPDDDGFDLEERDQLPWLEPAETDDGEEGFSVMRVAGLVVLGLVLLGVIVGGGWWLKHRGPASADGEASIIKAPDGAYKVAANNPDARKFEGEGDESYAASEGGEANGTIDASQVAETPMTRVKDKAMAKADASKSAAQTAKRAVTAKVADATTVRTGTAKTSAGAKSTATSKSRSAAAAGGETDMIQLGAYSSKTIADNGWRSLTSRFDALGEHKRIIEPVTVSGQTLYRLRTGMGSKAAAKAMCGKLLIAGESCIVVH